MSFVDIKLGSQIIRFDSFWLRDHCSCCINPETCQRTLDVTDIAVDIQPLDVKWNDANDILQIKWSDGHCSIYTSAWLDENQPTPHNLGHRSLLGARWYSGRVPWTGAIPHSLSRFKYEYVMRNDEGLRILMQQINCYGVAQIEGVEPTPESTIALVNRVGRPRETYFGQVFHITGNLEHPDAGYGMGNLPSHTDGTYFDDPPRLIFFHLIEREGMGGKTVLVDGLRAAMLVKENDKSAFNALCQVEVPGHYIEKGCYYLASAPTLGLHPETGELVRFRFNNEDRAAMHMAHESCVDFYRGYRQITLTVRDPASEFWFQGEPGLVTIVDNWRVTHGRSAFSGKRHLLGVYVSHEDYVSRLRTLAS